MIDRGIGQTGKVRLNYYAKRDGARILTSHIFQVTIAILLLEFLSQSVSFRRKATLS